jgi:hypothetical protein
MSKQGASEDPDRAPLHGEGASGCVEGACRSALPLRVTNGGGSQARSREQQAQKMSVGPSKYELQGPTV